MGEHYEKTAQASAPKSVTTFMLFLWTFKEGYIGHNLLKLMLYAIKSLVFINKA